MLENLLNAATLLVGFAGLALIFGVGISAGWHLMKKYMEK